MDNNQNDALLNDRNRVPIMGYGFGLGTSAEARNEKFGTMFKNILCPFFASHSFYFIFACV